MRDGFDYARIMNLLKLLSLAKLRRATFKKQSVILWDTFVFWYCPQPQQLFAFQVSGDSMIGDNIQDGDCVFSEMLRFVMVKLVQSS